jgi:hypothetical protein
MCINPDESIRRGTLLPRRENCDGIYFNRNKILRNVHSKQLKRKSNIKGICACCRTVIGDETEWREFEAHPSCLQGDQQPMNRLWTYPSSKHMKNYIDVSWRFLSFQIVFVTLLILCIFLYWIYFPTDALFFIINEACPFTRKWYYM